MPEYISGSCNCGRHKYTVPKPTEMNLCHCIDCRKWAGAMHSAHLFTKSADIDSHGSREPRTHKMKGDSGNEIERAWCDGCSCGIWIRPSIKPDGTFNPSMENWLKNREPWETPASGTKYTSKGQ